MRLSCLLTCFQYFSYFHTACGRLLLIDTEVGIHKWVPVAGLSSRVLVQQTENINYGQIVYVYTEASLWWCGFDFLTTFLPSFLDSILDCTFHLSAAEFLNLVVSFAFISVLPISGQVSINKGSSTCLFLNQSFSYKLPHSTGIIFGGWPFSAYIMYIYTQVWKSSCWSTGHNMLLEAQVPKFSFMFDILFTHG